MRQPKFKYYFQHEETGRFLIKIFTVCELAAGCLMEFMKSNPRWHVVDRVESTNNTLN